MTNRDTGPSQSSFASRESSPSAEGDVTPVGGVPDERSHADAENAGQAKSVGYGRPPVHTRFKPGHSGNRRGRPKGSKSIETICRSLLSRKVTIQDGGGRRNVQVLEAILLASSQRAIRGDNRAAKLIIELSQRAAEAASTDEPVTTPAQDQAIVAGYFARMMLAGEPPAPPAAASGAGEKGEGDAGCQLPRVR